MAWIECAISVDQVDPHIVGAMEGSAYKRRVRSGPTLKPLKTHAQWKSNRTGSDQKAGAE